MNLFFNRRVVTVLFLAFSSGLLLALSGETLQGWLTVEGVNIKTIGLFSLVGLPYTLQAWLKVKGVDCVYPQF